LRTPVIHTIAAGQRVAIEIMNRSMMAHPMHLHGHAFQVTALVADNPGRWAFHCHNLYHMATGMMTEVRYPGTT
jgi:FtsP/CotA-like multicopper oxidase with cupredoxin domain